jgi:hypothetical protein
MGTGTTTPPLPVVPSIPGGGTLPAVPPVAPVIPTSPGSSPVPPPADLSGLKPPPSDLSSIGPTAPPAVAGSPIVPPLTPPGSPAVPPLGPVPPTTPGSTLPPLPGTTTTIPTPPANFKPDSGSGAKMEFIKPSNTPTVTPVAGVQSTPKTSYDVDIYETKAGDNWEAISREFFNDTRYAPALQAYNLNKPLRPGTQVDIPPLHVLRQRPGAPQSGTGTGASTTMPVSRSDSAPDPWGPSSGSASTGNGTYRVPRTTTLTAIAKSLLGSDQRWRELYDLNPQVADANNVPEGTVIKLPAGARVP